MDSKLTLKLNDRVIARAKRYAVKRKTSVSRLVERYLDKITSDTKSEEIEITPIVKSLAGSLKLPRNFNFKKERAEYLAKKYK